MTDDIIKKEVEYVNCENSLVAILKHPEISSFISSAEGTFINASQRFIELTGYPEKELREMSFSDILLDSVKTKDANPMDDCKEHYSFEGACVRKDKHIIQLSFNLTLIKDNSNCKKYYFCIVNPKLDKKRIEEELFNINQIIEGVFDIKSALFAFLDKDFNFIRVNKRYAATIPRDISENEIITNCFLWPPQTPMTNEDSSSPTAKQNCVIPLCHAVP